MNPWPPTPGSRHVVSITDKSIELEAILRQAAMPAAGATVLFLGTTREFTDGRQTASLDYECYPEMALRKMSELESQARARWQLVGCSIVHRVGHVPIGEASVAIAVSTAHRAAAFEAGQWLIDTLKQVVPIWKQENWSDGESQWVHPGLDLPPVATKRAAQGPVEP